VFERLFKEAEIKKLTEIEMEEYRRNVMDYADVRDCVTCARDEGFEEGIEKGIEKGLNQRNLEVAQNCFREGMSVELTAKLTGLTPEQLIEIM
jgi:predicted transposase/invertase (TIGR01784 family)